MKTDTSQRIIEYILEKTEASVNQIVLHLGFSPQAVHRQLKTLVAEGELVKFGTPPRVYYQINPDKKPDYSDSVTNSKCDICSGLLDNTYQIFESEHWKVFPHLDTKSGGSNQKYLGTCVIVPKQHIKDLPSLAMYPEIALDFIQVAGKYENVIKKAFGAKMFNWMALMNSGWPNTHLHWRVYPRYNHDVRFAGIIFSDETFGDSIVKGKVIITPELKKLLVNEIKTFL